MENNKVILVLSNENKSTWNVLTIADSVILLFVTNNAVSNTLKNIGDKKELRSFWSDKCTLKIKWEMFNTE